MGGKGQPFKLKTYKTDDYEVGRNGEDNTLGQFKKNAAKGVEGNEVHKQSLQPCLQENVLDKKTAGRSIFKRNPLVLLFLSVLVFLAEIGVEVSLLLVQYISQKLSLNLFCALISTGVVFHILVILSLVRLKEGSFQQIQSIAPEIRPELRVRSLPPQSDYPTISKIQKEKSSKDNQKTTKLKKPYFFRRSAQTQGQTIKKIQNKLKTEESSQKCQPNVSVEQNKEVKMVLVVKLMENLYEFILASFCLGTIENPNAYGFSYVAGLIMIGYIIIVASSLLVIDLYFSTSKKIQQNKIPEIKNQIIWDQNEHIVKECSKEEQKPPTALSIEQHMRELSTKEQKNNPMSIEKIKSVTEHNKDKDNEEIMMRQQLQISPEEELAFEELSKQKRVRSVLKGSKSYRTHLGSCKEDEEQFEDEDCRRKVEINFKKNQVFQYEKSSVNSGMSYANESMSRASDKIKSKYVRSKYAPHNKIYDAQSIHRGSRQKKEVRKCKSAHKAKKESEADQIAKLTHSKFKELYS